MIREKDQFFSGSKEAGENQADKHPDYGLVAEKILICRAATIEQFGSPNVYRAIENLYISLYDSENIGELIRPNEKYPDRMDILKKHLSVKLEKIPNKEEFIAKIRRAMTREVDFEKCFTEEAKKQFYNVMDKSETTVVWTDGDALGVPEYKLPGSYEQICRIGSAKFFNQMRRKIAQKRGVDRRDVLSIVAVEGKMKFIPKLMEDFKKRGIEKVIIIEDRVRNLNLAIDLARKNQDMEFFPVWVRQGQHRDNMEGKSEEALASFHPINNISELMPLMEVNRVFSEEKKVGTIFDMDGVLSDDDIRKKIQTEAVIKILQKKGWV